MKKQGFRLRLLPVIAFTAVVILLVRVESYHINIKNLQNIPLDSSMELFDVFCKLKSFAILFIAIWAAINMGFLLITNQMKIKKTIIYIPMLIYTFLVILSYAMSDNKWIAWYGSVNRFEGSRTIICYMFMLFYTINAVDELRDAVIIIISAMISTFFNCLIGITQLIGHDIFLTRLGGMLLAGDNNTFKANFQPGQIYQTVSNLDYVGMYMALLVPALLFMIYYLGAKSKRLKLMSLGIYEKKRRAMQLFLLVLLLLVILNIYGAGALGGYIAIASSVAVLMIVICQKKWLKIGLIIVCSIGLIMGAVIIYARTVDVRKNIDYLETGIDNVKISVDGFEVNVNYIRDKDIFEFRDAEGNKIEVFFFIGKEGEYRLDNRIISEKLSVSLLNDVNGIPCAVLNVLDSTVEQYGFTFYEDGAKYLNPYGQEVDLHPVESIGFKGRLSFGNGRGYIWSRALPMLKEAIFVGLGADTFMFEFPQDDYAGKYSADIPIHQTCEKPHSLYLGIALGSGIVSLIAFLTMIIMAMWKAFRLGKEKLFVKVMAAGLLGFLLAGIVNDSTVCIMPMFYGILGSLVAMSISGDKDGYKI